MLKIIIYITAFALMMPLAAAAASPTVKREQEVRDAVTAYVQNKNAGLGAEVIIKRLQVNNLGGLPQGQLEYEVIAPQQWGGWGRAALAVLARKDGRIVGNMDVRAEIEVLVNMVFTVRQINFGTIISNSDLMLKKQNLASVQGRYIPTPEQAIGQRARMTLRPNVPIRPEQLEKPPLIKTGQLVTIIAENERMRITVTGKAKSSGAAGDTIIVQNLNSLKEMPARVLSADSVAIVY